jgi:hypothetical protein
MVIYQGKNGEIRFDADFKAETIWATQGQIAELFGVNIPAISNHLTYIYSDGDLMR